MTSAGVPITSEDLENRADRIPRVRLAHLPTPLEELPRFSKALGGPTVYIKRDDCTGLAMGGNKTRHNEFLLADALQKGADMFVWGAGVQSNNCRQTVASCAKLGLDCHLVLSRAGHGEEIQGNLLLDHILGATYEIVDAAVGPELDARITESAERFQAQGRNVYAWDRAVVKAKAAVSYTVCMAEIMDQCQRAQVEPAAIYVCSGGSTGAGLNLGRAAMRVDCPVKIILPIHWPWDEQQDLARIANEAAQLLQLSERLEPNQLDIDGGYVGSGYGIPTPGGMEAMRLLARTEGVLLDPVYTAKAMAALVDHVRRGAYQPDESVVFVHTGGTPALFAYRDELVDMIPRGECSV